MTYLLSVFAHLFSEIYLCHDIFKIYFISYSIYSIFFISTESNRKVLSDWRLICLVIHIRFIHAYILFQKVIQNYFTILLKIFYRKQVFKVHQAFVFQHKINKSNNPMLQYTHIIQSEACNLLFCF